MRRFKRIALYILTYLVMTFTSAFGVVLISNPTGANSIEIGESSNANTTPPQLNHIINNFSTLKYAKAKIDANIETLTDTFNISIDLNANLFNGLENVKLDGNLNVLINSSPINIKFVYADNMLYLSMFNGNFKIETNNVIESVTQILTLLNVEMPEIDLGMDLDNLNLDTILQVFSNLTEEQKETENILSISLPMVETMGVVCDLNYSIKNIVLPRQTLEGITFDVNVSMDYPDSVEVEIPNNDYIEVTQLFNIAEALINTINQKELALNLNALINDVNLNGKLSVNLNDFSAKFETTVLNTNLNIVFIDNVIYLNFGNINLKFALENIEKLTNLLNNQFDINIPLNEIVTLIGSVKNGELVSQVSSFDLKKFDISQIDLNILENLEFINNTYYIKIKDVGTVGLEIYDHKIKNINFSGLSLNVNTSVTQPSNIKIENTYYADVASLIPTLDAIINTTKQSAFSGEMLINYNNKTYKIGYALQTSEKLYFNCWTTILGKQLDLKILDNFAYINYSNTKIKCDLENLPSVINTILEKLNINLNNVNVKEIFDSLLDSQLNPNLISNLVEIKDGINIEFLNKISLKILCDSTIKQIVLNTSNFEIDISVNANTVNIQVPLINANEYTSFSAIANNILNLVDYINNKQIYLKFDAVIQNYYVTGFVNYDESLSVMLETTIENKKLELIFVNNAVYINFDGFKAKLNLSDIETILNFVSEKFEINFKEELESLTKNVDISNIISKLEQINIELTQNKFAFNIDAFNTQLNFENNILDSIVVSDKQFYASVSVLNSKTPILVDDEHFNISNAIPAVNSIINTIRAKAVGGKLLLNINNQNIVVNLKVKYSPELTVWAQTNILGCDVRFNLYKNTIYLSVDKLNVKVGINELDKLVNFINNNFNVDLTQIDLPDLETLNFNDIKILEANENQFKATIFGIPVLLTFNDYLQTILINYNNINAQLILNCYAGNVQFPAINQSVYENIDGLLNSVNSIIETIKTKNIALIGSANINNTNIDFNAQLEFENNIKAKINFAIFGKNVEVVVDDGVAYADIDGLKLKVDLNNLSTIFDEINKNFNIDINKLLNLDISFKNDIYIQNIELANNSLNVKVYFKGEPISINLNLDNTKQSNVNLNVYGVNVNAKLQPSTETIFLDASLYKTCINDFANIITPIKQLIDAKQLQITGQITFDLFDTNQKLTISELKLSFTNNLYLSTTVEFNGVSANVTFINNTIYVDAIGLKVKFNISEIPDIISWVNSTFNTNISLNSNDELDIESVLNKISLEIIKYIVTTPNGIEINIDNNHIFVDYNENFNKVVGSYNNINFDLNIIVGNIQQNNINHNEYNSIIEITNFVSSILDYAKIRQYNLNANAKVYNGETLRFDAIANLSMDLNNSFMLNGSAKLTGEQNFDFDIDYVNQYLYVNYNNLKLKICENDLKELLVIVLEMFGIDPTILPFLQDVANGMDIDIGNISNLIPNLDLENPLSMLNIIKNINYNNNALTIILNGKQISENPNADEMTIVIKTNGNTPTELYVNNLFTGVTENEFFNLDITFDEFNGITSPVADDYIDLSGANELIKAIVNTAELTYYEIDGSLKINGNLIGINIDWDVPLNVKVKLDENRNPQVMATIGEIPTIAFVNKGFAETVKNRMFYIYYKDSYVYLYQTQYGSSNKFMEKEIKLNISEVLKDPLYCLQFGIGFTDTIMEQIYNSLEKSKGHTPNLGNVVNYFTVKDRTNFEIQLNMHEITNDELMGNMTIGLGVVNNESTNNKNYVGTATFDMNMPLASVFELTLSSNNLKLINIGKQLDFTSLYNFVDNYLFNENAEMQRENHGEWQLASEITYTLSFVTNCEIVEPDITATINTPISIPTYGNRVETDILTGTRTTYKFDGWYTTDNFKSGTEFICDTMPRGNTTVYAKWSVVNVEYVKTITFNSFGGTAYNPISDLPNTFIDLSAYVPHKCDDRVKGSYKVGKGYLCTHTHYTFEGWYLDENFTVKFNGYMPDTDITLYAKYVTSTSSHYWGAFGTSCTKTCH